MIISLWLLWPGEEVEVTSAFLHIPIIGSTYEVLSFADESIGGSDYLNRAIDK